MEGEPISDVEPSVVHTRPWWPAWTETTAALSAGLSTLTIGLCLGYSSPTIPALQDQGLLATHQASWYGSIFNIGGMLGAAVSGFLADTLGRKLALILYSLPVIAGNLCLLCARDFQLLYIGRVLTGFGVGTFSVFMVYIVETASRQFRGVFGMVSQVGTTSGTAMAFAIALLVDWQWLTVIVMVPAVLTVISMVPMPETPRWLLRNGEPEKAMIALSWLRKGSSSNPKILHEYSEITDQLQKSRPRTSLSELWMVRKQALIGLGLGVSQQLSGINAVIFYTDTIFQSAGYRGRAGVPSLIFASVKAGTTILSTALLADRLGRKVTLAVGALGMALSLTALATYFYLSSSSPDRASSLSWLPLAAIVLYALSFGLGWGGLPGLIIAEIFPLHLRGLATGVFIVTNSLLSFLVTLAFLPLQEVITPEGVFWLLAGVCLMAAVFTVLCVPETRGRSLERLHTDRRSELQAQLDHNTQTNLDLSSN